MGDMWGMCIYESVQGAVTSTAQLKGLLASRSREESKQRGSSQFKVTCHQQRGSWVLGARMERDFQAHPHPEQSESARELRNLGTKSSKEKPALSSAAPSPGLHGPLSFLRDSKEVWLVQGQRRQIWDPSRIY